MSPLIELALAAHRCGYEVVACHGKAPIFREWQHGVHTIAEIEGWDGNERITNIGIRTGTVIGLDLDITDAGLSERAKNLALQILGDTSLVRIGRQPRQLLVYRIASPIRKKIATGVTNGITHKVEVLAAGQQFVAYGRHPDTLQPYVWLEADLARTPLSAVREVTEAALDAYIAALADIIGPPPKPKPALVASPAPYRANGHDTGTDTAEVLDALYAIPCASLDYHEWIRVGFALHAALGPSAFAHYEAWSRTDPARYKAGEPARKFPSFAHNDSIHAETLFWIAQEHGWKPAKAGAPVSDLGIFKAKLPPHDPVTGEVLEDEFAVKEEVAEPATGSATSSSLSVTPLATVDPFPIDPTKIPRRDWLIPNLLLRGHLSLLVAPPGTGKSLLVMQIAIMLAIGHSWGGWTPRKPAKSLIISIEDDEDEMRRRLWAACEVMKVDPVKLHGCIRLVSQAEDIVIMRRGRRTGEIVATDLEARIAATQQGWHFDNLIADPLSETHQVTENSNDELKAVAIAWRGVARRLGIAAFAIHHTPKNASSMAGSLDAARGGGALGGVARVAATLFDMSEEEAKQLGIEKKERRRFSGFDDAKMSYGTMGTKRWFEKKSVLLPNHGLGVEGDSVGAFVPWESPDAFDGIPFAVLHSVLNTIDAGYEGGPQRYTHQKRGDRRVDYLITLETGCTEAVADVVVAAWLKSGLLRAGKYKGPKHEEWGLWVDRSKYPGAVENE